VDDYSDYCRGMKISGLIFDLDGTLVRTINLYEEAVLATCPMFGFSISPKEFREIYKANIHTVEMLTQYGIDEDQSVFRRERDERYIELLKTKAQWYPDAKACVEALPTDMPRAILTGSWQSYVDAIEERIPLRSIFPIITTCDDFRHAGGKPNPYGLNLTAQRMGIDPKECMYIGDQAFDAEAARNAEMKSCIVRREYSPEGTYDEADITVESLEELVGKIDF